MTLLRRFFLVAFWAALIFAFVMAVLPVPPVPPVTPLVPNAATAPIASTMRSRRDCLASHAAITARGS